jgi:RHS repeat-associated protein
VRLPISRFLLSIFLSVAFFSATGWSGTFTVFGPQTYVRGSGSPVTVTTNFTVLNPNTQFTLRVHNGGLVDSATDFVSSTTITVNGVVVVAPNDLNQNIVEVDKPVTLQASNEIDVQVRGAPNGSLAVDIIGVDNDPPTITAAASPAANAAGWNNTDVAVSFSCADALSGIASCSPAATITTEGANQIVSGTATDKAGNTASTQLSLNIDKTPPVLTVASPVNGSTVATPSLQLSGSVSDALSGIASVSCNSTATLVQAGSFTCSVGLTSGANTITVSSTDVAGNTATKLVSVTLANQPVITDFTPKSGPAGTLITLTGSNLTLGNNTQITLNQLGGATIAAPISSASPTSISFVIPAGAATGPVTLTSAGQSATSTTVLDVTAASSFTVTAGPATATLLQGRTTAYSVSLASTDGFGSLARLSISGLPTGVTASFSPAQITSGQTSILTVTAPATQQTGNSTLTISAAATVDGISSTQSASVTLSVQPVTTSFFGRVVEADTNETPLPGIVITFLGVDDAAHPTGCSARAVADAAGNFIFTNLPDVCTGRQLVQYNGLTALDGEAYAGVNLAYTLVKGDATGPELVHLPDIQDAETIMLKQNAPTDQTFQFKTIPGITVTVYAGTVFTMVDGTQPDPFPFTGVEVPVDRLPDAPVDGPGTLRAFIVAFQPADTNTNQPVAVSFPNFINTPPGVNMELDTLDPVVGDLVKYGTGTVSGDGTQVVPDLDPAHPGHRYGIQHFDWHGPMSPAPNAANPGPDPNGPKPGDPVDAASGLFVLTKTDMAFGGARGRVAITRTYRTLAGTPGPFGVGTNHNYGYQLNTFSFIQGQGFITLIMPDGNQFQFLLQPDGTFVNTTIPMFKGAVLRATPPNFVLRYKDGTAFTFKNPPTGARVAYLSSIADRNGNVTTMVRGNSADPIQITQIVDPIGRALNLAYDNFDRITSITDPIGRAVSYTYNTQGTLDTVTDAAGGITHYAYDAQNRITSITDPRGIIYLQNIYDGNGKVAKQIAADGGVTQFDYTLLNPNASVTLAGSATTINTSPVLLTAVTDPLGNQTIYHYNAQGFVIDVTDALGEKTIYEREPGTNLLLSMSDPLNRTTNYNYDADGNMVGVTLPGSLGTIVSSFDPTFNKMLSITDPLTHTTRLAYDLNGNLLHTTDPLGNTNGFEYDGFGEQRSESDGLGNAVKFSFDPIGNPVSVTDPLGRTTSRSYDAVGRMVAVSNPLGQVTRLQYNAFNQITTVIDPVGGTTSFAYDPNGNLLSVTDPAGHKTAYTYDSMDRVASRTDPLGNSDSYQYDLAGNLVQFTDRRGKVTTYKYDALNRRTFAGFGTLPGPTYESTITYDYDAASRLVQTVDSASGTIIKTYDALDRLTSELTPQGGVNYTYDAAGRRATMTPSSQPIVTYSYDIASRLVQLSQGASSVSFVYDAAGKRTGATLPNGISVKYDYDSASELTGITYLFGSTTLGNLVYTYDETGKRQSVGGSLARTSLSNPVATATYNVQNQLTQRDSATYVYDKNGNVVSDRVNTYVWNGRNQLISIQSSTGTVTDFQYDAFGRRIRNAAGRQLLYDGMNVIAEISGTTSSASMLSGGVDEIYLRTDSTGAYVPLTDGLGSTLALANGSGEKLAEYTYGPFGEATASGTIATPFQYTGRENDSDGLYFYRARYYSPDTGRFLSEDPLQFLGGNNLYVYAANDPVTYRDPSGRIFGLDDAVLAIGGALVGVGVQFGHDVVTGQWSDWQHYAGSAFGGAVGGLAVEYTGGIASGALSAGTGNAVTQSLEVLTGHQCSFNFTQLGLSTAAGAAVGAVVPEFEVDGISAGSNSYNAVAQQIRTKLANGTIDNVTAQTAAKMLAGSTVGDAYRIPAEQAAEDAIDNATENGTEGRKDKGGCH